MLPNELYISILPHTDYFARESLIAKLKNMVLEIIESSTLMDSKVQDFEYIV